MDRQIVYPGQIAVETDLLKTNRNTMIAIGKLAGAIFGTGGVVNGLVVGPSTPAALSVSVAPGEIYQLENVDSTAYSSLPADTTDSVLKQGIALAAQTLACAAPSTAGYSINYLIQATYQDSDTGAVALPYYNASNPTQAYSGPNNSGTPQATQRSGIVVVNAKAGTAATTGSQVTPTVDSGYIALAVVTVANGQTTITSSSITAIAPATPPTTDTSAIYSDLASTATGKGSALVGFLQSGANAVPRTVESAERDIVSGKSNGALGDNATDDTAALASLTGDYIGRRIRLPFGKYKVTATSGASAITFDYSGTSGTPADSATGTTLNGEGVRGTVIVPQVAGMYAMKIIGGPSGFAPYVYSAWGDFSISVPAGGVLANGAYLFDTAFMSLHDITLSQLNIGLKIESCLSSSFDRISFYNCVYGVTASIGTGFSGINAMLWSKCNFQFCTSLGYQGVDRHIQSNFEACNFEGCGTTGVSISGGIAVNCDSTYDGRVGGNFNGCYFEANKGGFDLSLYNAGTGYVTYNIIGCNFNRIGTTDYVTNNILAQGKVIVNLIGCSFTGFGGYVNDPSRLYVAASGGAIVNCFACAFDSAVSQGSLRNAEQSIGYAGTVTSAGAAASLPVGWTVSKLSTGIYKVVHNLGLGTTAYVVTAATNDGSVSMVQRVANGANDFTVVTTNTSAAALDAGFGFQLTRV